MSQSQKESGIKVDFRTFSILLLLAAIPLLIGVWWLIASHEEMEFQATGAHLSNMAETAFSAINGHLQNQIISVACLTEVNLLRDAVAKGNLDLQGNLFEVRRSIPKMESAWRAGDRQAPVVKAVLENPASDFLRRYIAIKKQFRQITVTDFLGRSVAATTKSPNYYFAHEDWWKETYGDGFRGSVYIGDVRHDPEAKTYLMDIAQPFVESEGGVMGVIRVEMYLHGIDAFVGSIQSGPATSVALIHARGDVISAPGFSSLQTAVFPSTLEILNAREKGRSYFVSTNPPGSVFGLSQRSFPQMYPHLNWIVVGTDKTASVLKPLHRLRTYVVALIAAIFLAALIAAAMLSRVESKPVIEEDPHLEQL